MGFLQPRFQAGEHVFKSFLDIMNNCRKENKSMSTTEVYLFAFCMELIYLLPRMPGCDDEKLHSLGCRSFRRPSGYVFGTHLFPT